MAFCGLILGALIGFYFFGSYYFIKYFTLFSILILGLLFIYKVFREDSASLMSKALRAIFPTVFIWIFLCGVPGFLWLIAGEEVFFSNFDVIALVSFLLMSTIGVAIYVPLTMVWGTSRIGVLINQNIRGLKVLLGFGG